MRESSLSKDGGIYSIDEVLATRSNADFLQPCKRSFFQLYLQKSDAYPEYPFWEANKHKTFEKRLRNDQISRQIHCPKGVEDPNLFFHNTASTPFSVVFVCTGSVQTKTTRVQTKYSCRANESHDQCRRNIEVTSY